MSNPMLELAERVERAGADEQRAMLEAAWDALNTGSFPPGSVHAFEAHLAAGDLDGRYESAAMMLVPEGWGRVEFGRYEGGCDGYWAQITPLDHPRIAESERCATPALALTAACLRSRASMGDR